MRVGSVNQCRRVFAGFLACRCTAPGVGREDGPCTISTPGIQGTGRIHAPGRRDFPPPCSPLQRGRCRRRQGRAATGSSRWASPTRRWTWPMRVVVDSAGVRLKPKDGAAFSIDFAAKRLDLRCTAGDGSCPALDGETGPAGSTMVALKVNADPNVGGDSFVRLTEGGRSARCAFQRRRDRPSAECGASRWASARSPTHDRLRPAQVRRRAARQLHAGRHLRQPGVLLKPALRLVDNLRVGAIGERHRSEP